MGRSSTASGDVGDGDGGEEKERRLREDEIRKKGGERKKRGEEAEDGGKKIGWRPKREKKKR